MVVALRPVHVGARTVADLLSLAACKSKMGHTEPAAGIVGAISALYALGRQSAQPLFHLNQVRNSLLHLFANKPVFVLCHVLTIQ